MVLHSHLYSDKIRGRTYVNSDTCQTLSSEIKLTLVKLTLGKQVDSYCAQTQWVYTMSTGMTLSPLWKQMRKENETHSKLGRHEASLPILLYEIDCAMQALIQWIGIILEGTSPLNRMLNYWLSMGYFNPFTEGLMFLTWNPRSHPFSGGTYRETVSSKHCGITHTMDNTYPDEGNYVLLQPWNNTLLGRNSCMRYYTNRCTKYDCWDAWWTVPGMGRVHTRMSKLLWST